MTLAELARLTGALMDSVEAGAGHATLIAGVASLEEAQPGEVSFFGNQRYAPALRVTQASAVFVPLDFAETVPTVLLRVANPSVAFAQAAQELAPAKIEFPAGVHPTAILGEGVEIDPTASVQAYAVIEAGAVIGARSVIGAHVYVGHGSRLGEDCHIYPHVTIRERSLLGNRVIIHSSTVIGSDGFGFELVQGRHVKIPQIGIVQIDDDVEIGAATTIDRARFGRTWIQEGAKIDNLVQIAHNVIIGPHCLIISQTGISGSAKLGRYVTLAGQVGVVGHVKLGDRVVVAAKSGASKDVPAGETLFGMIGVPIAEGRKMLVHYHKLPETMTRLKALEREMAELRKMLAPAESEIESMQP